MANFKTFDSRFQRVMRTIIGIAFASISVGLAAAEEKVEPVELNDIRGMRYCEFLLIFDDRIDVYNTSDSAGCPEDLFKAIDVAKLAEAHGANKAQLNGPHFWAMDEQTLGMGGTKTFSGIEARYAASLPLSAIGAGTGSDPYKPYTAAKQQTMIFKAGNPVYELVDPDGNTYALNAYGAEVKDGDPANLANQLKPAEGWSFKVNTPSEDLTIEGSTDEPVQMVGDDFHQYYTRFGTAAQ